MRKNAVYIPSLDGKDIYIANNYINNNNGYSLYKKDGKYNLLKFINTLDYSLDLIKLRETYSRVYKIDNFSFEENHKEYIASVINVTFKYSNKEYNKLSTDFYVKFGYMINEQDLTDGVYIVNGELLAIKTNTPIKQAASDDILDKYFIFDNGVYKARTNIRTLTSVADIRSSLYTNGFICDGIHYVRFKRSSGSSRVGKCLFIDEKLYKRMHEWEMCGINVKEGTDVDLASLEPYIALTLSSIIDTIEMKPENILVVDDYKSVFTDNVVATRLVEGCLETKPEKVEISNSIWDGQSLMDISVFEEFFEQQKQSGIVSDGLKGMLLLRARFFKSCCFNTNIQKWFSDNNITETSQLNGYTRAKRIEDIKLITTPSSIKYLKFGTMNEWFDSMESVFGVVKYEKKTHFFDGRMVQTHYQLLNTLQMTPNDVEQLVMPSLSYAEMIKTDPAVLKHQIGYQYQTPDEIYYTKSITSKNDVIYKLLDINDVFKETNIYRQFCNDLITSFIKNLRQGHILIHGNYSTLCGNPIEMLKQAIGIFDGSSIISPNTVHCCNFDDNIDILGSRSPHVTIGNILVTRNVHYQEITEYMNPTSEIVYVNSINENLLERLSGSDFDSDTLLLTDNSILVNAAKRNYDKFPVPTKLVESEKKKRRYSSEEQADLDIKTSVNKIGEIINLSQELNSLLWDRINHGDSIDASMELYCDIAQLDIMSNLEIDSAKRENPANNTVELQKLKRKYDKRDKKDRHIRPLFFKYIDSYKGYCDGYYVYKEDDTIEKIRSGVDYKTAMEYKRKDELYSIERGRMTYRKYETTMDYLQKVINKFRMPRKLNIRPLSDVLLYEPLDVYNLQLEKFIINLIRDTKSKINDVWRDEDTSSKHKRKLSETLREQCINDLQKVDITESTLKSILNNLERNYSDISRVAFFMLLDNRNYRMKSILERILRNSKESTERLVEDDNGNIEIYQFKYRKEKIMLPYENQDEFREYVINFLDEYKLLKSWITDKIDISNIFVSYYLNGKKSLSVEKCKQLYNKIVDYKARLNGF